MIKILFICHGNICRSPMSEFILKDMVTKRGISDRFQIASAATSREEIGIRSIRLPDASCWSTALTLPVKQPAR